MRQARGNISPVAGADAGGAVTPAESVACALRTDPTGRRSLGIVLSMVGLGASAAAGHAETLDVAALLILIVITDIVRIELQRRASVLGTVAGREVRSGFVDIPLDLRASPRAGRARGDRHLHAEARSGPGSPAAGIR